MSATLTHNARYSPPVHSLARPRSILLLSALISVNGFVSTATADSTPPPETVPDSEPETVPETAPETEPETAPETVPDGEPQTMFPQRPRRRPEGERPAYGEVGDEGQACCRWSVRYDPFDLLTRRVTLSAEVALADLPLSIEVTPKYIFGSPASELDEQGFDLGVNLAWYPSGVPLRGIWVKAHAEYERFTATLTRDDGTGARGKPDPNQCAPDSTKGSCKNGVASTILGVIVGSTQVFGPQGGFAISGGIGIGAALADSKPLTVLPCTAADVADKNASCEAAEPSGTAALSYRYYDNSARIRLLGTLSLGVVF